MIALTCLLLVLPLARGPQAVRLDAEPAPLPGRIERFADTADGRTALFVGARGELCAAALEDGSQRLLATPAEHGEILQFESNPRGTHVHFWARRDGATALWRVPVTGGPATQLTTTPVVPFLSIEERGLGILRRDSGTRDELVSLPLAGGPETVLTPGLDVGSYQRTARGDHLLFTSRQGTRTELFAVAVDGSSPPALLSPPESAVPGRGVSSHVLAGERVAFVMSGRGLFSSTFAPDTWRELSPSTPPLGYALSPDGLTLYVVDDYALGGKQELWRLPTDGASAPERLNPPMPNRSGVKAWRLARDGRRIAYAADLVTTGEVRLYLLELETLATREIGLALPRDGNLASVEFAPGEHHVVVQVNGGSTPGRHAIELATDATFLLGQESFTADGRHLLSSRIEFPQGGFGHELLVRTGDAGPTRRLVECATRLVFRSTADGRRVLFSGDAAPGEPAHLWSLPIEGGRALRLDGEAPDPGPRGLGAVEFSLSPDEKHALYLAQQDSPLFRQYVVPTDGSRTAAELDRGLFFGRNGRFTPDGRSAVLVGTSAGGQRLYRTSSGSGPLVPLTPFARFVAFQLEPSSRFAIVTLSDGPPLASGTLAVRLADGAAHVIEPAGVSLASSTSDGRVFLYLAASGGEFELFAFDLVRGERRRLSHALAAGTRVSEFAFSPATGQVAYTTSEPGAAALWIVPSDGSAPAAPVLATTTGPALRPQPSPDGQSFTFAAPTAPGRVDLFRVASTGGVASNLSAASGGFAGVQRLGTVPGDAHLLVLDGRGTLFSLATTGGVPLALASGRLHFGSAGFALSPDGRTTYLGRTDGANRTQILAVPVAGGPEQVLSGALEVGLAYGLGPLPRLSPDGRWLAFLVESSAFLRAELQAVPTDGSRPPQRLHEAEQLPLESFVAGRNGVFFVAADDALLDSYGLYLRPYSSLLTPRKR